MPLVIHVLRGGHTHCDTQIHKHAYIHTEVILRNQVHVRQPAVPGLKLYGNV